MINIMTNHRIRRKKLDMQMIDKQIFTRWGGNASLTVERELELHKMGREYLGNEKLNEN